MNFSIPEALNGNSAKEGNATSSQEIEAALQGRWSAQNGGSFDFSNGNVTLEGESGSISGTYTTDTDANEVVTKLNSSDGKTVTSKLPYKYSDGKLELFNNRGEAFQKN